MKDLEERYITFKTRWGKKSKDELISLNARQHFNTHQPEFARLMAELDGVATQEREKLTSKNTIIGWIIGAGAIVLSFLGSIFG